jgi:tRNA modification GTPase
MSRRDTIAAIATAQGRAGVGVVRVSGEDLAGMHQQLTGRALAPRHATLVTFHDAHAEVIDQGLALYFPQPHSYTGEDVLELHGHGGPIVLRRLLERCLELGARIAQPGEFTRRAFLNGKLDLVQAESVIDLIDATTTEAARSAMRSLRGEFSSAIEKLGREIVELRALIEASLDFPEEELDRADVPSDGEQLRHVRRALDDVLEAARRGSVLREGLHIALAGQPNVGKSSLINRLAGEELAIVTDVPGTTRDAIRQMIDLQGVPAHIVDTAGLRESHDRVERIGVERAWDAITRADVVLLVADARTGVGAAERDILERIGIHTRRIVVMNKIDLVPRDPAREERSATSTVWLSAKSGEGLDLLRDMLVRQAGWQQGGEGVFLARARHLEALEAARTHLASAQEQRHPELIAEELRRAHDALTAITGEYTADDLLGEIFARFCIGK